MASPLQYGDPPRLGPFVIQARLHSMPAGFVYLGQADDGRAVSIALLTRGAALDGAARDRFVTAVRESSPRRGTVLTGPAVLESDLGEAPWAATPYLPGRPGAERYLEPVMVGGILLGEVHGPDYVPYWLTDRAPALPGAGRAPRPATETRRRVLLALGVLLALLLMGVVIAILLFRGLDETEPLRRPLPPTVFEPTPPPTPESQQPQPEPSPSPSQSTPGGTSPGLPPGEESDPGDEI